MRASHLGLGLITLMTLGCQEIVPGRLYVTAGFDDRVYVLDAATGAVVDTVNVDRRLGEVDEPHGVAVAPDGRHWYATVSHGDPTLWKFEAGSDRTVGRVTLPQTGAARIGISPDGRRAAIPDYFRAGDGEPSSVTLVELATLAVLETVTPCAAPHDAQFDPSGGRIAITCSQSDEVVILDAESSTVLRTIPLGGRPMNLVWLDRGERLLVTRMSAGMVSLVDPEAAVVLDDGPTGSAPAQIALSPDGMLAATANRGDASVSLIDPSTLTERRRVTIPGAHPHGITFDSSGEALYVTYEGTTTTPGGVVAMNRAGDIQWHSPVGTFTLGIAYSERPPGP